MFPEKIRKNEAFLILALVALCLTLFFFRLGAQPLWDIDEGKHATTSKEMILSEDWITPKFNGEPFYDKPVFYNWLVALARLSFRPYVADRQGDKLLISNRKSPQSTDIADYTDYSNHFKSDAKSTEFNSPRRAAGRFI
jgi:hypothetical protein